MNTLAIISNPLPKQLKPLWGKAKKINPKITREEFFKAVNLFKAHNNRLPKLEDMSKKKITKEQKILVYLGDIKSLDYKTKNNKKDSVTWRHDTNTPFYCSYDGKKIYVNGMTVKKDGFLYD